MSQLRTGIRSTRKLSLLAGIAMCACAAPEVSDQLPAPVPIAEWASRVDTLPGTYTQVGSSAEVHDSLLIIPDMRERVVWRINVRDLTRSPFASQGGGPGEYNRPGRIVKVHRDSVAILQGFPTMPFPVIDVMTGRGRTQRLAQESGNNTEAVLLSVTLPFLVQADTLGRVYGAPMSAPPVIDPVTRRMLSPSAMIDTAPVVRFSLFDGRVDTLLQYATGFNTPTAGRDAEGAQSQPMSLGAYGPYGDWHVTQGGDVITVDASTYTVRYRPANSGEIREFTVPFSRVPVSDSGWEAHVQRTTKGSTALLEKSASNIAAQMGQAMTRPAATRYAVPEKPAFLPPVNFAGGGYRIYSANSTVWIPVHRTEPPLYPYWDLVDFERGERMLTLQLPSNQRLLHVSGLGAYAVAWDDDDLQRVLLYRRR